MPAEARQPWLARGVWKAAWLGPGGGEVLIAVSAAHRLLAQVELAAPDDDGNQAVMEALQCLLDTQDPLPARPTGERSGSLRPCLQLVEG